MDSQLSWECDVSDIEYASSDNSYDDSDFEQTDYKIEFEEDTLENFESCIADTNYTNSVVLETKYVILPILYLIFIISILQIILLKINITINTIIIMNIFNDPKAFYIAFIITLIITMIASILSIYGSYKWSFIALNKYNTKTNNKYNIKQIINTKSDVLSYKKQIKFALNDVTKICYDNNNLELLSKQLFLHKQELIAFQQNNQQKTGRKIFKNYIKEIDKQYQDIMQIINENELAILSTVLCKLKIQDLNIYNDQSIDIRDYNNYLTHFNQNTIKEFNFYGGYHGMNKNKQNTVDIKEFEKLIENVIDLIDENSYTFLNY